ncbi:MAG: autoinducer-2 kinase [Actinobacteria bacterium]|nr:MAG: autoinducer-2 kinase [Actinomycetota bacterium]
MPERRLARRGGGGRACPDGCGAGDLRAFRRLGCDHRASTLPLDRAARARHLRGYRARRHAGRLDSDPALRRVRNGSFAGVELRHVRALAPDVVRARDRARRPRADTVVGGVTAAAAAATGLREGTPCVVGGADTQLGLVGIGVVEPNRFTVVGGSFWQHTVVLDEPLIDPDARLRTLCHAVLDRWMMEGIGFYSGLTMRWFRDAFCQADQALAAQQGADVYDLLAAEAATVPPGSNGVLGIFSNLMEAKRWVHASPAFLQFDIENPELSGKKECFRAIEEAAAYVSRGHLEIVEEVAGLTVDEVVFTGGASKGRLWQQILADVLDLPVRIPHVKESTAFGAAICAGVGAGLYSSLSDAAKLVQFDATVEPQPAAARQYRALYDQWRRVYERVLDISEDGVVRSLWRAAGT